MKSKTKRYAGLVVILLLVIGSIMLFTKKGKSSSTNSVQAENIQSADKSAVINKELSFPIKNEKDEEISQLKYTIESAELRDEIIVKGQKATSVKGKTFLILTIKLANSLDKVIQVNTRDYVRLIRNGNPNEQLAPEIHNDPVEIQPISIKYTRIGFSINDSDTDLQLQVGEIKGAKEIVPITF